MVHAREGIRFNALCPCVDFTFSRPMSRREPSRLYVALTLTQWTPVYPTPDELPQHAGEAATADGSYPDGQIRRGCGVGQVGRLL